MTSLENLALIHKEAKIEGVRQYPVDVAVREGTFAPLAHQAQSRRQFSQLVLSIVTFSAQGIQFFHKLRGRLINDYFISVVKVTNRREAGEFAKPNFLA